MSREWVVLALAVAAALAALAAGQYALVVWLGRRPAADGLRDVAWSFAWLLPLWPLFLAVTWSDAVNHAFTYQPGIALWWGLLTFGFVGHQALLVPSVLDGGWRPWQALRQALGQARRASLDGPNAFPVLLALFAVSRLTLGFAFDTSQRLDKGAGYDGFYELATLTDQGVYPYLQRWSEYPPVFPWFATAIYRAVSFFGVTFPRFQVALMLALLLFACGNFLLVYKLAEAVGDRRRALLAAGAYGVLVMPAHAAMRGFEDLPIFFFLLAVYWLVHNRPHAGALAAALGVLTKLVPVALAPAFLRYTEGWRARSRVAAIGAGALAAVLVPLAIAGRAWFVASFQNMFVRPPWETVWALLDGTFTQGWVNPYRLSPDTATQYDHAGRLPGWFWPLLWLALLAFYGYLIRTARSPASARTRVAFVLVSLIALQLTLKGWSPSFILWDIPLLLVLAPTGRGFAVAVGLTTLELFRWAIYYALGAPLWWTVLTVSVRTCALAWLGWWALQIVRRSGGATTNSAPQAAPLTRTRIGG
ncbi:MAG: hypothetical protein FJ029_12180 [Actinobacteria bacterium]|nr:hypothetical protein [Actinomycetota bacterium]